MMASEKRLIDGEELWKKFESEPWYDNADRDEIALPMVYDAPTVDAVEVVRCKDCKHYMEYPLNKVDKRMCCYVHLLTPHFTPEDGFCSYGERKDNE